MQQSERVPELMDECLVTEPALDQSGRVVFGSLRRLDAVALVVESAFNNMGLARVHRRRVISERAREREIRDAVLDKISFRFDEHLLEVEIGDVGPGL